MKRLKTAIYIYIYITYIIVIGQRVDILLNRFNILFFDGMPSYTVYCVKNYKPGAVVYKSM